MCTWVGCEGRGLCPVASQPVKTEKSITDISSGRELARVCRMCKYKTLTQRSDGFAAEVPVAASLSSRSKFKQPYSLVNQEFNRVHRINFTRAFE